MGVCYYSLRQNLLSMINTRIQNLLGTKLWLFPLSFILYFFLDQVVDVFYGIRALHFLLLFVLLGCLLLFFWAISMSLVKKALAPWPVAIVTILITFYWFQVREDVHTALEQKKIIIRHQQFSDCIKNATHIPGGGVMGVCEHMRYTYNAGIGIYSDEIIEAIIYDSTDQIVKKESQRSDGWYQTAVSLQGMGPFPWKGYYAKKLIGHFYYVSFGLSSSGGSGPNSYGNYSDPDLIRRLDVLEEKMGEKDEW